MRNSPGQVCQKKTAAVADIGDAPQQKDPAKKSEVSQTVDHEGLDPGIRGRGLVIPETDEQIGTQADQFPGDEKLNEVIGQDNANHREGEQTQEREELGDARVFGHVSSGIDKNGAAHTGDDQEHHDGQRIDEKSEVNGQAVKTYPCQGLLEFNSRMGVEYLPGD